MPEHQSMIDAVMRAMVAGKWSPATAQRLQTMWRLTPARMAVVVRDAGFALRGILLGSQADDLARHMWDLERLARKAERAGEFRGAIAAKVALAKIVVNAWQVLAPPRAAAEYDRAERIAALEDALREEKLLESGDASHR